MTRRQVAAAAAEQARQVAAQQHAIEQITDVCRRAATGDFEARVPPLPGPPALAEARDQVNAVLDVADAFVREASACLVAAVENRFERALLPGGLRGDFRRSATVINDARQTMRAATERLADEDRRRGELADYIQQVAEHVAAASVELGASAGSLASSASNAVDRAGQATATVESLERSSGRIQQAVALIKSVAAQTRLLSLNASIEAARAGRAGLGFAVVANEVKSLADEVSTSSDDIATQVDEAQQAAMRAVAAIREIAEVITEMDHQVAGVAAAARGDETGRAGEGGEQSLAHLAETLRQEIYKLNDRGR